MDAPWTAASMEPPLRFAVMTSPVTTTPNLPCACSFFHNISKSVTPTKSATPAFLATAPSLT